MLFIVIKKQYHQKLEIEYPKIAFLILYFKNYIMFAYLDIKYVSAGK